jgi:hypothetical protein
MALFSVTFLGSTPIGGPLIGWIAERFGARDALGIAGVITAIAGLVTWWALRRDRPVEERTWGDEP